VQPFPPLIQRAIDGKHVPVLDGIRGFAVSFVILYHFIPSTLSLQYKNKLLEVWDSFWLMGWSGVDLFFVLSGFLITGILYKAKSDPHYFRNFYARRFLRIFPIYYLLLVACLVVAPRVTGLPPPPNSIFYWFYLSNFDTELRMPIHPVLVVAWSLSIEEQYYLCYPALVRFLSFQNWMRLLIGLVFLSLALRFAGHYLGFFIPRQEYHFTLAHFDGIALGGLFRLWVMRFDIYEDRLRRFLKWLPLIVITSVALGLYCGHRVLAVSRPGFVADHVSFQPPMYLIGYSLNTLCYAGLVLTCIIRDGFPFRVFSSAVLIEIGKVSYGMYLLQYPARMLFSRLPAVNPYVTAAGVFITCYLMAKISWVCYESQILKLKSKFAPSNVAA